jgi:hypothetical protein
MNDELLMIRDEAEHVPCPYCGVTAGVRCVNKLTDELNRLRHVARIRAARAARKDTA